jgi:S-adenosylmethionine hydrolase
MAKSLARRPIVTLTTDFGTADHFTAAMKGVILSVNPQTIIVDVTHEIHPFEITEGAFVLNQSWRWYPAKTVHVGVVDPGVGSDRRPILVEAGRHFFVGPDNGIFSLIYEAVEKFTVRHLTAEKFFQKPVSRTFHGRDIFAPVAAHLAAGVLPSLFGPKVTDPVRLTVLTPNRTARRAWSGIVLKVDRFGNLITNYHIRDFGAIRTHAFEVTCGLERINRLALSYSETEPGELFVIVGSSGYLEVAANQDSAARRLGCGAGAPVDLELFG